MAILLMLCTVQLAIAYENAEYSFSISFPSGWEQTESSDVVALYANADGSASINIIVEETNASLADYVAESKVGLENLDYYELISEGSRTIGGLNAYELVFAWTLFPDNETYYDIKDKQVLFVQNGKAFTITCGSDYSDYNLFLPTFEQTLESFRLTSSGTLGMPDSTLIIVVAVIAVAIVLIISIILFRRKRQLTQRQFDKTGTKAPYPSPPQPPPP